jgi:hypothetical protein
MPRPTRNLVIVRAGDRSLHPAWTAALETRNWDLVASYFGDDPARFRDPGERRIDDKGPKWSGLHALLARERFWREYDYVWLPDDDLMIEQIAVDRLFARTAGLDLELSQPGLSWRSFYSHEITIRHPSLMARYTNFIEIMAPCFRREFLETCLALLGETQSGWGLDWILPRMQPKGRLGCAIIDDVEMTHTRPVGGPNYAALKGGVSAADEGNALLAKYGVALTGPPPVYAAVDRSGRHLDGAIPAEAALLHELLATDAGAFLASRRRSETAQVVVPQGRAYQSGRWGR